MISLLVYLIIVIVIFGVLFYCVQLLPIQPPFRNIAYILLALVLVLVLLGMIGLLPLGPHIALQ